MPSSRNTEISPHFRDMLGLLLKHGVEFLLIGGHAMSVHDVPRFTDDIDFFVRPSPENARRLWKALLEFGAPLAGLMIDDFTTPRRVIQFGRPPDRIDFTMSIEAVSFDEAWRDRVMSDFHGIKVPVLSREHLIRNKLAVGRDKDLLDAKVLKSEPKMLSRSKQTRPRPKSE